MMLLSLGLIFIIGIIASTISRRLGLPGLVGLLLTGIFLGPFGFNLLDASILAISSELRQIALIIILLRAGLTLDISDLRKIGRPALLMCFVPALFEIAGSLIMGPLVFGLSIIDSLLLGSVLAAVSPAVVVPKMITLIDQGYGTKEGVPQLVLAGASVDDVVVIVLFTSFLEIAKGGQLEMLNFLQIPTAILFGILAGILSGFLLAAVYKQSKIANDVKVLITLAFSFILYTIEQAISGPIGFSGLLAVMTLGMVINKKEAVAAKQVANKFNSLWAGAEILLFTLVASSVDVSFALNAFFPSLIFLLVILTFRMLGVWFSTAGSHLTHKERLFCMLAYLPKATVQAAIGGIPLANGLISGNIILTVAVIAILFTAPLGAFAIEKTHHTLLNKER